MGQVTITLNGRSYRLRCGQGEEHRLLQLAGYLSERIDAIREDVGQVGDDRLFVMAALTITDELWEVQDKLKEAEASLSLGKDEIGKIYRSDLAKSIAAATSHLEDLNERLSQFDAVAE